ncbi:MAG: hypothetical protein KatS3mg081_1259 [Gemmatimonadales bacterium]|nr:hypothetical protein HRbin33_00508 [bacterium HR33]GIW51904.1 MAG: hypothetical protein KatS3mg081_1259 [Gemmatimonadales bacterium]
MKRNLRELVLGNWPIKLTALVLAAVLWAAVAAEEPTTQLVPVSLVVQPPEGRALTTPLPPVKALYAGSARELIKLYGSPPTIVKTIPDTVMDSEYLLELRPEDLMVDGRVDAQVQDIQPRAIRVRLDDVARRTVPVVARVRIVPDSGYMVTSGVAVVPSSVTVRGPEVHVRRIEEIKTLPVEIVGATGPIRRSVQLDTAGFGTVQVFPASVEIAADVEAVSERVLLDVPVSLRGTGAGWVSEPARVIVTLRGPASRVAQVPRDSVTVVALVEAPRAGIKVPLQVIASGGITGTAVPDSVELRRRTRD